VGTVGNPQGFPRFPRLASPRAKATILKALINARLSKEMLLETPFKEILDLCVNCKSCRVECPTGADIPLLSFLAKENYVKQVGAPIFQQFTENMKLLGTTASRFPGLCRIFTDSYAGKLLMELTLGIDRRRQLPKPSIPAFENRHIDKNRRKKKVVYFYGCFWPLRADTDRSIRIYFCCITYRRIYFFVPDVRKVAGR